LVNTVEHSNAADAHLAFVHPSSPNNSAAFINGTTFISDIQKEVSAHKITGDQAVTQLAGFAHEFPAQQSAVANEIASLIDHNQVTAAHAMADIGSAVTTSHTLGADEAVALLANLGAHYAGSAQGFFVSPTNVIIQSAAANEISTLVSQHQITADHAIQVLAGLPANGSAALLDSVDTAIATLIHHGQVTANHVLSVLAGGLIPGFFGVASIGNPFDPTSTQVAVGREISYLVSTNHLSLDQATNEIVSAMYKGLPWDQALTVLMGMAAQAGGSELPMAIRAGVLAVVEAAGPQGDDGNRYGAPAVANALISLAQRSPDLQVVAAEEIVRLVQTLKLGGRDMEDALLGMAKHGNAAVEAVLGREIGVLASSGGGGYTADPTYWQNRISGAVTSGELTGTQAREIWAAAGW
jgi:hypothetical protein